MLYFHMSVHINADVKYMGRCLALFFEFRLYLVHLRSVIVTILNVGFFVIYLLVSDPNKDYNNNL